jgi:hypothetical protein
MAPQAGPAITAAGMLSTGRTVMKRVVQRVLTAERLW